VAINPSGIPPYIAYKRQLPINPGFDAIAQNYQRYRIPRPPEFDPEGTEPGKLCWGTVGAMPSPEPLGGVGFTVKENYQETSRISQPVRVENPDDPSQYVMEDRPHEVTFDKTTASPQPGPNTSSLAADFDAYSAKEKAQFTASGVIPTSQLVKMKYKNPTGG
jgi:hypothetical protein